MVIIQSRGGGGGDNIGGKNGWWKQEEEEEEEEKGGEMHRNPCTSSFYGYLRCEERDKNMAAVGPGLATEDGRTAAGVVWVDKRTKSKFFFLR